MKTLPNVVVVVVEFTLLTSILSGITCIYCACRSTVKHILIECPDFELGRQKYFNCNSLPELFEKTPEADIMTYLKEIGLYSRF